MTGVTEPVTRPAWLRRHRLVHLGRQGWCDILANQWDDEATACLRHWMANDFPLVVSRQPADLPPTRVALGVAAPLQWSRRRLAVTVHANRLSWFDDFPHPAAVSGQLASGTRNAWLDCAAALARAGVRVHVYGSRGWQALTALNYVRAHSDIDVWLSVESGAQADLAVHQLALCQERLDGLQLDGELMTPAGEAVSWRDWLRWRGGDTSQVLVKRIDGVHLTAAPALDLVAGDRSVASLLG